MTKQIQAVLEEIDGGNFIAECPAFGAQVGGGNREQALANLKDAVQAIVVEGEMPDAGQGAIELTTIDVEMP